MKFAIALSFVALSTASCLRSYGQIDFSWTLADADGTADHCVDGEVVQIQAGAYASTFPCTDSHGTTDSILSGRYSVKFSLLDATGAVESTATQTLVVPDAEVVNANPIVFTVTPVVGTLKLTWSLENTTNNPVNCAAGETVLLVINGLNPIAPFTCTAGQSGGAATIDNLPVGTYTGGSASLLYTDATGTHTELDAYSNPVEYPFGQVVIASGTETDINAIFAGLSN